MKFNIEQYPEGDAYVMHCKTREEIDMFASYLDSIGRKWNSGHSYLDYIPQHNGDLCYVFNENKCCRKNGNWLSAHPEIKILEFSDFDWDIQSMENDQTLLDDFFDSFSVR